MWHGVSVLPRARKVLETELRKLAPAAHVVCFEIVGFENWSGQPDLHRHPLNGVQESWLLDDNRNERRGLRTMRPRAAITTKRTNTAANSELEFAPAGEFHGGSFGVSGTPPGARQWMSCEASGLESQGRGNQTIQVRS